MDNFYESILNLRKFNSEDVEKELKKIIFEELSDVKEYTTTMDSMCKLLSNNIKVRLDELKLNSILVNLKDYGYIDHQFILASFKDKKKEVNYLLIDATYSQFMKCQIGNDLKKSNEKLLEKLLNFGYSVIDNYSFKNYINSFKLNLTLDEIILNKGDFDEANIKNNKK